jgi:hypothetical protein
VSKMMVTYLASIFGVSPFRETQDPRFDPKIDLSYRDSMLILAYVKYMQSKMPAGTPL